MSKVRGKSPAAMALEAVRYVEALAQATGKAIAEGDQAAKRPGASAAHAEAPRRRERGET